MYKPKAKGGFTASDMIFEKNMGLPILQVACGTFHSSSESCLAILHSRKLIVASLTYSGKELAQYRHIYEHSFDRNAFNLISGNFGKSSKTQICVQSVDGALFFFDQEVLLFQIQLPDFLIPGPFTYSATLDSILVTNSNLEIECYKYSSL